MGARVEGVRHGIDMSAGIGNWQLRAAYILALLLWCAGAFAGDVHNLALGARYTIEPAANYEFTRDADDATQLTDGHYVAAYFFKSHEAVGWDGSGPIRIEIDLGTARMIDSVCINTVRDNRAGVSFPERVDLFVSTDGKMYSSLGDVYQGAAHEVGDYLVQKFCASRLAVGGRYVLLGVQPKGASVFLDEIEVLGSDVVATKTPAPLTQIRRAEIGSYLKAGRTLRAHTRAVAGMAVKMLSHPNSATPQLNARISALETTLEGDRIEDLAALEKIRDELFALHREAMAQRFTEPVTVWRKDPWAAFIPVDSPMDDSVIGGALDFDAMQHGTASNAFVITNNSEQLQSFRVDAAVGGGSGAAPRIETREVVPVIAANYEVIGDALKPLSNSAISLKPGESKQVWLSLFADASGAGEYAGKARITSHADGRTVSEISLRVRVWPAALPERQRLFVNTWSYLSSRPIAKFPQLAVRDLYAHHVNVLIMDSPQIPWPIFLRDGAFSVDYSRFDRLLSFQKGARKQLFALGFNDEKRRTFDGQFKFMSATWKIVFKKWIADWVGHLKAQGLGYEDFTFYPVDEPRGEAIGYLVDTARMIKEVDPKLQVYTTIDKVLGGIDLFRLAQTVDIFQINVRAFSAVEKMALVSLGKQVWLYSAYGGGKQANPTTYYRMQAWRAFRSGAEGAGFWAYADTGPSGEAWDDFDGTRPDFSVIYESDSGPVSSKRWEAWRAGVEDYELLTLAHQKIKSGKAMTEFDTKIDSVINNASDYQQLELTRRYLLSVASSE